LRLLQAALWPVPTTQATHRPYGSHTGQRSNTTVLIAMRSWAAAPQRSQAWRASARRILRGRVVMDFYALRATNWALVGCTMCVRWNGNSWALFTAAGG